MTAFLLIVRFIPLVISLFQGLEVAFPNQGFGPFKLSLAMKLLVHFKDLKGPITFDSLIETIPGVAKDIVDAMNTKPESWTPPKEVSLVPVAN